MNIIFVVIYCVWFATEIFINGRLRSKSNDRQNADKNSLLIIWVTIILSISFAVWIATAVDLFIFRSEAFRYIGLAIIIFGVIFRLIAVASLGRFFTVDVTIRKDHRLKKDGIYKYLRHPSYLASLLSFIGLGVSLNNWISLLLITTAMSTVFIARIKIEERLLIEQFGSEYLEYKKHTSGFIPFIY